MVEQKKNIKLNITRFFISILIWFLIFFSIGLFSTKNYTTAYILSAAGLSLLVFCKVFKFLTILQFFESLFLLFFGILFVSAKQNYYFYNAIPKKKINPKTPAYSTQ